MGILDFFSKKSHLSDFFTISLYNIFKYRPVFVSNEVERDVFFEKYELDLKQLEMSLFHKVEICKFMNGEYSLEFISRKKDISEDLKSFISFMINKVGLDDTGKGDITEDDIEDCKDGIFIRVWSNKGVVISQEKECMRLVINMSFWRLKC